MKIGYFEHMMLVSHLSAHQNRFPINFDQSRSFKFQIVYHEF